MSTDRVIVLAAGRGLRAGGPKALHRVHNRPWWHIQRKRLALVGLPVVWVISDRVRASMTEHGGPPPDSVIADELSPMFTSVLAGCTAIAELHRSTRGVFILPVDVPAPNPTVFNTLARATAHPSAVAAALPTHNSQRGHPVYLSWPLVTSRLLSPSTPADSRLDHLIEDARVEVPVTDPGVLINLNTADDFTAWANVEYIRPG